MRFRDIDWENVRNFCDINNGKLNKRDWKAEPSRRNVSKIMVIRFPETLNSSEMKEES